jgi:hypothetical protein
MEFEMISDDRRSERRALMGQMLGVASGIRPLP